MHVTKAKVKKPVGDNKTHPHPQVHSWCFRWQQVDLTEGNIPDGGEGLNEENVQVSLYAFSPFPLTARLPWSLFFSLISRSCLFIFPASANFSAPLPIPHKHLSIISVATRSFWTATLKHNVHFWCFRNNMNKLASEVYSM